MIGYNTRTKTLECAIENATFRLIVLQNLDKVKIKSDCNKSVYKAKVT